MSSLRTRVASVVGEERAARLGRARRTVRALPVRGDLPRLAEQCGTDKWGVHRYAAHYQRHLRHLRRRPVRLLEIGVGGYDDPRAGGESLRMWKQFFPRGQVFGLDVHDKSLLAEPRITVFQGSQGDPVVLRRVAAAIGRLDVVIDDGSHRPEHVRTSFETLFPLLADGGIYAIEDVQTSYWPEFGGSLDRHDPSTSMGMVHRLVDGLNHEEFLDEAYEPTLTDRTVTAVHCYHNLVVLEKGDNAEGSNKRHVLTARFAEPPTY